MKYLDNKTITDAKEVFNELRLKMIEAYGSDLVFELVGSSKLNLVVVNKDNLFDLDYQLRISKKISDKLSAKVIKEKLMNALNWALKNNDWTTLREKFPDVKRYTYAEDSTSAITFKFLKANDQVSFSCDIAILLDNIEGTKILRNDKYSKNYIWNPINKTSMLEINKYIKSLSATNVNKLRESYLNLKIKNNNNLNKKSSSEILIDTVHSMQQRGIK